MNTSFALDLKVARKKAGYTQQDCAHLLDIHPSKVSQLENGNALPSIKDICTLSLLYGKSFERLFGEVLKYAHQALKERLATLPDAPKQWLGRFNRENALKGLERRLIANDQSYGA